MDKKTTPDEQYDKIYRYCYFKLHRREVAEDITQETFLRYLKHYSDKMPEWDLRYLYRIAHNLCVDEFRKRVLEPLPEIMPEEDYTEEMITTLWLRNALGRLSEEEREILLLRYANEAPNGVICQMLGISRFVLYRKTKNALHKLRKELGEEGIY